jgi:hypothetical protein
MKKSSKTIIYILSVGWALLGKLVLFIKSAEKNTNHQQRLVIKPRIMRDIELVITMLEYNLIRYTLSSSEMCAEQMDARCVRDRMGPMGHDLACCLSGLIGANSSVPKWSSTFQPVASTVRFFYVQFSSSCSYFLFLKKLHILGPKELRKLYVRLCNCIKPCTKWRKQYATSFFLRKIIIR